MFQTLEETRPSRRLFLGLGGIAGFAGAAGLTALHLSFPGMYTTDLFRAVQPPRLHPQPLNWPPLGVQAAWLGHSTVLLQVDGFRILTDPVFGSRVGVPVLGVSVGVKRLVAPALGIAGLPPIDLILLSHAHMDHFDIPSLRRLQNRRTTVLTARNTAALLPGEGYGKVLELGWDDTAAVGGIRVRALRVKHFGGRAFEHHRGYNGYLVESGRYRIVFAGDTAFTTAFRDLRTAGPIDLALMPIGGYRPWHSVHCTPEEAWQMAGDCGAARFIPIHHRTFPIGREPPAEPLDRLLAAAGPQAARIPIREIGAECCFA